VTKIGVALILLAVALQAIFVYGVLQVHAEAAEQDESSTSVDAERAAGIREWLKISWIGGGIGAGGLGLLIAGTVRRRRAEPSATDEGASRFSR